MGLQYVDDPSRYVGEVVMVARPGERGRLKRPEKLDLDAFTAELVKRMDTRTGLPFITQAERERLLERLLAEIEERHEVFPEAADHE